MTEINLPEKIGKGYASFWQSKHKYRVVKGGRGSKKSTTMAQWLIYNIMKYPKSNALVVRKTYNTHRDSTFALLQWAVNNLGVQDYWKFTTTPLEAVYTPTGQKILFRGFDDVMKLTSITVSVGYLCWVWIEEAYEIDNEADFDMLDESIRGLMPDDLWIQTTLTFNPWISSHWIKKRFFDFPNNDTFTLTTDHRCNEWLSEADHKKYEDLLITNPDRGKVSARGEWGLEGGQFFDEFSEYIHVTDSFIIPKQWHRYGCLDYGLDMTAFYCIATSEDGTAYVYKELYKSNLIISEAANEIKMLIGIERLDAMYAPPDLYSRQRESGRSTIDIFAENGLYFIKASNKREQGWLAVKEYLKVFNSRDIVTGDNIRTSKLKIFKNCINLIRTLPQLITNPNNPNDIEDKNHELTHAPDSLRYWCVMRKLFGVRDSEESNNDEDYQSLDEQISEFCKCT